MPLLNRSDIKSLKPVSFDYNEEHQVNWIDIMSLAFSLIIVLISLFIPFVLPFIIHPYLIIISVTVIGGFGIGINMHYYSSNEVYRNKASNLSLIILVISTVVALFTWISLIYVFTLLSSCYVQNHMMARVPPPLYPPSIILSITEEEPHDP